MVVAILLFVAAVAVQNMLLSVKASEEQTVKAATVEYATLRNVYAEQYRAVPSSAQSEDSAGVLSSHSTQIH